MCAVCDEVRSVGWYLVLRTYVGDGLFRAAYSDARSTKGSTLMNAYAPDPIRRVDIVQAETTLGIDRRL
jgi:hypothetical protein